MNSPVPKREPSGRLAIFNIDGCISDDRWRRARVPEGASQSADFAAYHDGAKDDPPLQFGAAILANHIANGDFIAFATGREIHRAEETATWIRKHFAIKPNEDFIIMMRDANDQRAVVDVKMEQAQYLIKSFCPQNEKTVIAAYDNRNDVVQMYRSNGFDATILNEDGEFLPEMAPLREASPTTAGTTDNGALSLQPNEYARKARFEQPNAFVERVRDEMSAASLDKQEPAEEVNPAFKRESFIKKCRALNEKFSELGAQAPEFISKAEGAAEPGEDNRKPVFMGLDVGTSDTTAYQVATSNAQKYPKYFKDVSGVDYLDVYLLLEIFDVRSHAIGHAIKKLLLPGSRTGGKSAFDDVKEARDTLNRWLEMESRFTFR